MALPNLTNQNIQDTYQRVIQTDGENIYDGTGSALPLKINGPDLIVSGAVRANSYIVSESIIVITSGSTVFGDSADDQHQFTGSLHVSKSIEANNYDFMFTGPFKVNAIREVGSQLTIGSDHGSYPTVISSSQNLFLHSSADTFFDVGGDDFRIRKSDTEFFRFNLDTDPKIDATGDLIIDPSGGDMHLHGSDLTVTGSINASGDINGTIDGGSF